MAASTSSSANGASRSATFGFFFRNAKVRDAFDDLQVVPEFPDGRLHRAAAVRQRQHAHHLREVGVGGRADEQAARLPAGLVRVPAEPRSRAAGRCRAGSGSRPSPRTCRGFCRTRTARPGRRGRRPCRARRARAAAGTGVLGPVHEAAPVEVVHVPLRAGPHESGGHDRPAVEPALLVERLAMDQPARPLAISLRPASCTTNHSGKRHAPMPFAVSRGSFESGGRRVELRRHDARHDLELAREPGLEDLAPGRSPSATCRGRRRWPSASAGRSARPARRW